jgi:hypothetical protein
MRAEVKIEDQKTKKLSVVISCDTQELKLLSESLQQAFDERVQGLGTHLLKIAQKIGV